MQQKEVTHFCVRCLSPNPVGHDLCWKCGTRLMLISDTAASRYEDGGLTGTHVEHLLERVSALENRMNRLNAQLARAFEFLARADANPGPSARFDTLVGILAGEGLISEKHLKLLANGCADDTSQEIPDPTEPKQV